MPFSQHSPKCCDACRLVGCYRPLKPPVECPLAHTRTRKTLSFRCKSVHLHLWFCQKDQVSLLNLNNPPTWCRPLPTPPPSPSHPTPLVDSGASFHVTICHLQIGMARIDCCFVAIVQLIFIPEMSRFSLGQGEKLR